MALAKSLVMPNWERCEDHETNSVCPLCMSEEEAEWVSTQPPQSELISAWDEVYGLEVVDLDAYFEWAAAQGDTSVF